MRTKSASAAALLLVLAGVAGCAARAYPVEARYAAAGPYAVRSRIVDDSSGTAMYYEFYPRNYPALHFPSPIITWGNGTGGSPKQVSTLLGHFASYGFTVIASTDPNTGSGEKLIAAAHYLVKQDTTAGSTFRGRLDIHSIAAVGVSQGAGGAVNAATHAPHLISAVMTFSLPDTKWVAANPGCPQAADCMFYPSQLTQPVFFVSTRGIVDSVIAAPATERAFFGSVPGHAALGIIRWSDGRPADHMSVANGSIGGNPGGFLGYATAWLEYELRGDTAAAPAFTGPHPELLANSNWKGSAIK